MTDTTPLDAHAATSRAYAVAVAALESADRAVTALWAALQSEQAARPDVHLAGFGVADLFAGLWDARETLLSAQRVHGEQLPTLDGPGPAEGVYVVTVIGVGGEHRPGGTARVDEAGRVTFAS